MFIKNKITALIVRIALIGGSCYIVYLINLFIKTHTKKSTFGLEDWLAKNPNSWSYVGFAFCFAAVVTVLGIIISTLLIQGRRINKK